MWRNSRRDKHTHFVEADGVLQRRGGVEVVGGLDVVVDCGHGEKSDGWNVTSCISLVYLLWITKSPCEKKKEG